MSEADGRKHTAWAMAATVIAIALIVAGGALLVLRSARSLPAELAEGGRQALSQLRDVAAAFRTGTITTTFRGDATTVEGASRLQFAELRQVEVFERRDAAAVLWGALALPDVVVEARVPVTYTYYLDLDKEWHFRLADGVVFVAAPAVEWNRPAADISALRFTVREDSMLRDEQQVIDRLRGELTPLLARRARQNVALVREAGRRKVEAFVETWLIQRFADGKEYRARVTFADEPPAAPPHPPVLPSPQG